MVSSVSLYSFKSDDIKIDIEARFEDENLIIDGYDIGKKVNDYWGDVDYEYTITIPPDSVVKLYPLLNVSTGDKNGLLNALALHYKSNSCFSDIRNFLDEHQIACTGFSWS